MKAPFFAIYLLLVTGPQLRHNTPISCKQSDCLSTRQPAKKEAYEPLKFKAKAALLKTFARSNNCDVHYCFLIDMRIPSGKKRFFIYDLNTDSVVRAGLVAHGCCRTAFLENVFFSNNPSCECSSFGKYKIGAKYNGRFGKSYKLYGLDSSNSNAFKRAIVLHADRDIPDMETYPTPFLTVSDAQWFPTTF